MSATIIPLASRSTAVADHVQASAPAAELARLRAGLPHGEPGWAPFVARFVAELNHLEGLHKAARKAARQAVDGAASRDGLLELLVGCTLGCAAFMEHCRFGAYDHRDFDSFDEYLLEQVGYLVKARALLGAEPGPIAEYVPATSPKPKSEYPPVRVVALTPRQRAGKLRAGATRLRTMIDEQEAVVANLRGLDEIVTRGRAGGTLSDADCAKAFRALVPVECMVRGQEAPESIQTLADEIMETLGVYFGFRVWATGGLNSTWAADDVKRERGWTQEEPPYGFCRDVVTRQARDYGLAPASTIPPVPVGCEDVALP
jgi:hypothetical protein